MMKILILFLIYSVPSLAYDPKKMEEERKILFSDLGAPDKTSKAPLKNLAEVKRDREVKSESQDLESLYFDSVQTKAAAPKSNQSPLPSQRQKRAR